MKFIAEKIDPGSSLAEYLAAINSRVFFWASPERLDRLRQAKEYRTEEQVVLHVDTRALVERHGSRIELRHPRADRRDRRGPGLTLRRLDVVPVQDLRVGG
nr:hypothetical protein [Actinoplanes atraurantiacus]